jgi:hypothetical protein
MIEKRRGRPSIGKATTLILSTEIKAEIERLALQWDVTQSRAARELIAIGLSAVTTNPTSPFTTNATDEGTAVA